MMKIYKYGTNILDDLILEFSSKQLRQMEKVQHVGVELLI